MDLEEYKCKNHPIIKMQIGLKIIFFYKLKHFNAIAQLKIWLYMPFLLCYFNIGSVFNKYQNWSCNHQDRKKNNK